MIGKVWYNSGQCILADRIRALTCELLRKGDPALHGVILKFFHCDCRTKFVPKPWTSGTIIWYDISLYTAVPPETPVNLFRVKLHTQVLI